jgi:cytochrome P450 PksS
MPEISFELADPRFKADPHPTYARLRAEAPVFRSRLGRGRPVWLVTRYDDVATLLRDPRFPKDPAHARSGDAPWMPGFLRPLTRNMLDLDAPDHTRLRSLVQKAFTPRLVERLRPRIEGLADELIARATRGGRMELVRDYALPIPLTIIGELLGIPAADRDRFHRWSTTIVSASPGIGAVRLLPTVWSMFRYLRGQFAARRADPRDDLITALVQAEEAGDRLSDDELLAMVFILLVAGHETTVNLISGGVLALLQNPEQLERLRSDPALLRPAVEELARFVSPVDLATERYAREDVEIAGVAILPRRDGPGRHRLREPRRDALRRSRRAGPRARPQPAPRVRPGRALLPGRAPRPPRGLHRHPHAPRPRAGPAPARRGGALAPPRLPARPTRGAFEVGGSW